MIRIEKKVTKLLEDYRPEHSEYQIENFIIGSDGNLWGRYKQALRELAARHAGITTETAEIKSLAANIARLNGGGWNPIGRGKRRENAALMRSKLILKQMALKPKMREYAFIYKLARDLKRKIGEIDPQKRRELEAGFWREKALRMAAIDLLSTGGIQRSTAEFILSLPRESRRDLINQIRVENRQKLLLILE